MPVTETTTPCECGHHWESHYLDREGGEEGPAWPCAIEHCPCGDFVVIHRPAASPASTGMETPSEPGHLELTDEAMAARQGGPAVLYVPATPPVSEDIGGLIDAVQREYHGLPFGLSPNTRCVAARTALDAAVASLRRERDGLTAFARDVTTNYDHDADAHRYNNGACLVCKAERALTRPTPERTDG
jgi:hypothetical protein